MHFYVFPPGQFCPSPNILCKNISLTCLACRSFAECGKKKSLANENYEAKGKKTYDLTIQSIYETESCLHTSNACLSAKATLGHSNQLKRRNWQVLLTSIIPFPSTFLKTFLSLHPPYSEPQAWPSWLGLLLGAEGKMR